jgi:arylamine N-acetyltransferase
MNPQLESWDHDNPIQNKSKQIMKFNFQSAQHWRMKLKKIIKKWQKNDSSQFKLICEIHDPSHETKITSWKVNKKNHKV